MAHFVVIFAEGWRKTLRIYHICRQGKTLVIRPSKGISCHCAMCKFTCWNTQWRRVWWWSTGWLASNCMSLFNSEWTSMPQADSHRSKKIGNIPEPSPLSISKMLSGMNRLSVFSNRLHRFRKQAFGSSVGMALNVFFTHLFSSYQRTMRNSMYITSL